MERPVMFVQSLLVLVVAIYVISACNCGKKMTMEEAICANITLMMGSPKGLVNANAHGMPVIKPEEGVLHRYNMYVNIMYHEGRFKMQDPNYIAVLTAMNEEQCGVKFEDGKDYFISGSTLSPTLFLVHSCNYVENVRWFNSTEEELERINDVLTRHSPVNCSKTCISVGHFGVITSC